MVDTYIPVDIDIKDASKHAQVAVVLDNDRAYDSILEIRKKYGITKFYNPKKYENHAIDILHNRNSEQFVNDVQELRKALRLPPFFTEVFLMAILNNKVSDEDFESTYLNIDNTFFHHDTGYSIALTPKTTWKKLSSAFSQFKKIIKDDLMMNCYVEYIPRKLVPDTVTNIERNRGWYWEWKNGKKPLKISEDYQKRGDSDIYRFRDRVVKKSLASYKKLLKLFSNQG